MREFTTLVNIFNQTERQIRCIANEHDYLGDGTVFNCIGNYTKVTSVKAYRREEY